MYNKLRCFSEVLCMIIVDVMMSYSEVVSHGYPYLRTVMVGRSSTHLQLYSKRLASNHGSLLDKCVLVVCVCWCVYQVDMKSPFRESKRDMITAEIRLIKFT